jgi:hypothetical protein
MMLINAHQAMGHFINIFGAKADQLLCRSFLMMLMATAFWKNEPKFAARHTIYSLKHAAKFQQKC